MQANKIDDLEVQVAVISALSERSGPLQVPGESTPTEEPLTLDDLTPLFDAKADGDYVDAQLDLKADGNYVDAQLDLKAGRDDVDTQLDLKADGVYVDEQLALKPNSATIMPVINGKADTQAVIDLEAQFNTIQAEVGSCVQLCEANIQPAVNAEIALDMDMSSIEEGATKGPRGCSVRASCCFSRQIFFVEGEQAQSLLLAPCVVSRWSCAPRRCMRRSAALPRL